MKLPFDKYDRVECPRENKLIDSSNCFPCKFARIVEYDHVKCGWSELKEKILSGEVTIYTS